MGHTQQQMNFNNGCPCIEELAQKKYAWSVKSIGWIVNFSLNAYQTQSMRGTVLRNKMLIILSAKDEKS